MQEDLCPAKPRLNTMRSSLTRWRTQACTLLAEHSCNKFVRAGFSITPLKSGFKNVQLLLGKAGICSCEVNPRVTLGRIMLPIFIHKAEKQGKVLRVCLEHLLMGGPCGNQTFLWGCSPQESPITFRTFPRQIFPNNP